jgi:cAMP-dependent protein kinase regulator
VQLDALRTDALRHLAAGDFTHAMRVYEHLLRRVPEDLETRMRVSDVCVQAGRRDLALQAYAAVVAIDLQGGRPLHALVAMQALADLGEDVTPFREAMARLYGADSPRVARVGGRLAPPAAGLDIEPVVFAEDDRLEAALEAAAALAGNHATVVGFPPQFQPVPLLSDLPEEAFRRLVERALVHRLPHGALVLREGDAGQSIFLVAAGQVRVSHLDRQGRPQEIGRLHEGALFGEMALVSAQPRNASVEVVGAADLIELRREALQEVAGQTASMAAALDRFTRDRLVRTLLATSPLFRPFTAQQRLDLVRRFTGHEVEAGTHVIVEGEAGRGLFLVLSGAVEVVRGEEPFESVVATLGAGECFGEISLLRHQPAVATVRAVRRSTLLFLAREYFDRLVDALPEVRSFFEQLTDDRLHALGEDAAVLLDDDLA